MQHLGPAEVLGFLSGFQLDNENDILNFSSTQALNAATRLCSSLLCLFSLYLIKVLIK